MTKKSSDTMSELILTKEQFDRFMNSIVPPLSDDQLELETKYFVKLHKKNLPFIYDVQHLSNLIGVSHPQLKLFISNAKFAYTTFKLPKKKGGFRTIDAPSKVMKSVQRWILDNILYKLNVGEFSHGFVPGKSIVSNASVHVGQDLVLGIDIKDFFPSITRNRVVGLLKSIGYKNEIAYSLGEICTFNKRLPQGAPTSPMLSNLIALNIDIKLSQFCKKRNLNYSRYADDITISGGKHLPKYKTLIFRKIEDEGFSINWDKVRLHDKGSSQRVTGLIVNDGVSLGRKKKKKLRAIVHNILKNGPEIENREDNPYFKETVFGELSFAKMVDPDFANPLIEKLKCLDWMSYDINMADSREGELIVRSLEKKRYTEPVDANQTIESEDAFLQAILDTIAELKHQIEDRRWTEPFWNDARDVMIEGKKHKILASPKQEPKIQPTIHVFFDHKLRPFGIHVLRETYEGIGSLDFKFLITIKGNIPLNVCAELKLAHSDELEHGLITQLPLYLKASPSNSGIYLVMWFKDEKGEYFNKPTNKDKSEMLTYLEKKVKEINENDDFKIESILIDTSKRPSASKS